MSSYTPSAGAPLNDPLFREELLMSMRRLIQEGYSDQEVAMRIGCADRTVMRFRHRHDIPAQSRGGTSYHRKNRGH